MIPAMGVLPGGEEGAEEHEELEIYLWVRSVGAGVAGGGVSSESSRPRRVWRRSGSVPAELGERNRVGDLQWPERDPFRGSARAEVVRRRGSSGELPAAAMVGSDSAEKGLERAQGGAAKLRGKARRFGAGRIEAGQREMAGAASGGARLCSA